MRVGLGAVVRSSAAFSVCAQANEAPYARELFRRLRPDLVVLGLSLSHGDGIELLKDFRKENPSVGALVLTAREDPLSVQRAFRAGARGYILASDETAEILRALALVSAGQFYSSPNASRLLLVGLSQRAVDPASDKLAGLSDRELQIFRLIGSGFGATRIAAELRVSVKTVESHRSHIKEKLGLATGAQLNAHAARWLLDTVRNTHRARHSEGHPPRGRPRTAAALPDLL